LENSWKRSCRKIVAENGDMKENMKKEQYRYERTALFSYERNTEMEGFFKEIR
jgi:hypothetical protein